METDKEIIESLNKDVQKLRENLSKTEDIMTFWFKKAMEFKEIIDTSI